MASCHLSVVYFTNLYGALVYYGPKDERRMDCWLKPPMLDHTAAGDITFTYNITICKVTVLGM